jgi:hypothetical protein
MHHPFEAIPTGRWARFFFPLLAASLTIMLVMNFVSLPLNTPAAPSGIVSFEFSATPAGAQAMLDSWSPAARLRAAFIQGLDFLFPPVYATATALACVWAGGVLRRRGWALGRLGSPLGWGLWLAMLFDYVENIALVVLLFAAAAAAPWPQLAALCATVKFILLLAGLVYGFYGLAAHLKK